MQYSLLGNTGLKVSRLALGTVALGMDYGFRGSPDYTKPDMQDAIRIIHRTLDLGINFIDTARTYGEAEEVLGVALKGMRDRVVIASKVVIDPDKLCDEEVLVQSIESSIEMSLRALRVETLDLVQIHNATPEILANGAVLSALVGTQKKGKVRFLGTSCVGEDAPLAALKLSQYRAMMVPFNILDRLMIPRVFPQAQAQGVGIMARSAFLRGVLTGNLSTVPEALLPVKQVATAAAQQCVDEVQTLSELALRFCLSYDAVSTVVIGVRSIKELEVNVADAEKGQLSADCIARLSGLQIEDHTLVTPGTWQGLI
ncbi:MAG: aldo/keto reductase [Acidobacteria bacterium]|nr:aldo/keto reductase [Acidobacteriota bacterium]